jgi:hypothetical protein
MPRKANVLRIIQRERKFCWSFLVIVTIIFFWKTTLASFWGGEDPVQQEPMYPYLNRQLAILRKTRVARKIEEN